MELSGRGRLDHRQRHLPGRLHPRAVDRHSQEEYPWLVAGDEVTLSVETMGEIRASVVASARGAWPAKKVIEFAEDVPA